MMKHWNKSIMFAALLACAVVASAAGKNFGLGFMVGDPTGFSAKLWTSGTTALDFGLGWSSHFYGNGYYDDRCYRASFRANNPWCYDQAFGPNNGYDYGRTFHFHADYLFHNFNIIHSSERFPLYAGPGLSFNYVDQNYAQFGIRGDFGIAWLPRRAPMDVFFELAPVLEVFPYPDFDLDASLGTRFYF